MHFSVSMEKFRCFAAVGPVRIAPITILIGENSSGKTSFLAGLRELIELFNHQSGNAFNSEPYYLGSFEQIAHYRGGKAGRAKNFSLEINSVSELPPARNSSKSRVRDVRQRVTFSKGAAQPELTEYFVSIKGISAHVDMSGVKTKITVSTEDGQLLNLTNARTPGSELVRRDISFLWYYLQDVLSQNREPGAATIDSNQMALLGSLISALQHNQNLNRDVFASAPVRTQPRRIYTPSELNEPNPGEQVPLQIANLKLIAPERWAETKRKMTDFGKRSGLFEDIEIKRFGRTTGDPFALQIKNVGPFANVVDVGYGVSQALPLLFPLEVESDLDFFLLQQPEVHLHPRAQAEFGSLLTRLSAAAPDKNYVVETHSDYILDRIRTEIRDGKVPPESISILLFRRDGLDTSILEMGIDEDGEITNYPSDYRSFFLEEQARVLGL